MADVRRALARAHPGLGRLASFLALRIESGLGADVETGAHHLCFERQYAERASSTDLVYWLAHATLHAALQHFIVPPGKPEAWSQACDATVERLLRRLRLPAPALPATERHAWWLAQAKEEGEVGRSRAGAGVSDEQAGKALLHRQARQWRTRVHQALGEALARGDAQASLLCELVDKPHQAAVHDWRVHLAAFIQRWHKATAHYGRPSRRSGPPFLLPALRPAAAHIVLAVDISASIDPDLLQKFWTEIQGLAGQIPMQLTLLAADTRLAGGAPWRFAVGEVPFWPAPQGQGGTDFRPVFAWLAQCGEDFDALIYFTDGKGDYPSNPPHLPVLWVVAGPVTPPFGEVIRL